MTQDTIRAEFTHEASARLSEVERAFGQKLRVEAFEMARQEEEKRQRDPPPGGPLITHVHVQRAYDKLVPARRSFSQAFLRAMVPFGSATALGGWGLVAVQSVNHYVAAAIVFGGLFLIIVGKFVPPR